MAKIPNTTIADKIDAVVRVEYPRPHLGASVIGHKCRRYLVYTFNWAYRRELSARMERIFRLGDAVETIIISALESIGVKHFNAQVQVFERYGFFGGSIDGMLSNVPGHENEVILFEAKSAKNTKFNEMKTKGVSMANSVYYSQLQMYMHRLKLHHALFCVMNKDTSEIHTEIVPYDPDHAAYLELVEEEILKAQHINEFPRLSNNPSWFECKYCDAYAKCHKNEEVADTCRTCKHRTYMMGGIVWCNKHDTPLNPIKQAEGCPDWLLNDMWR